ncbi:MAG TPA: hypothetical protein VNY36_01440, partial [Bacteroidia bacterium]|nr:hypothetical protein [Bacteroidia bacterium]
MKKLLLLTTALFAACNIFAQSNSIPNPSFENWSTIPYVDPLNCQTSNDDNLSKGFPVNVFKVADPYHANYAVQMKSIKFSTDTLAAYFAMGNPGGGGGPSGGSPINGTPSGVRLYYKYTVKAPDTAIVIVEFKKAGTIIGQYLYQIFDTTSTYLLFSQTFAPALSATPDTVIIACASSSKVINSHGNSSGWAPGSVFQVDSLTLTSIAAQPQDFDGDFEKWQNDTIVNLQGWSGTNNGGSNSGAPIRTTDARSGKYAVELITYYSNCNSCSNPVSYSEISSGKQSQFSGPTGGLPYNLTHDTLEFYYKYVAKGNPNDTASVELEFHNFSNQTYFNVYLDTSSIYKKVVYPFTIAGYTPDSVLINIYSSFCSNCFSSGGLPNSDLGSDLKIDSMRFTSQIQLNVTPANPSFCAGSNVKLTASGATTYTWAPSSGLSATTGAVVTANPFSTTTYTVTG